MKTTVKQPLPIRIFSQRSSFQSPNLTVYAYTAPKQHQKFLFFNHLPLIYLSALFISAFSHTPQVNGTIPTVLDQNPTIKIKPFPHPTTSFPLHGSQQHVFLFLLSANPVGVSRASRFVAGRGRC